MKKHIYAFFLIAACLNCFVTSAVGQAGTQPFVSEAVDKDMYKEGEVHRLNQKFQEWDVVCDEIVRQKRRFCSLSTFGKEASGRQLVHLTVSTSDDGKPAAMLRLPFGISIEKKIEIEIKLQAKKPDILKLVVPYCDVQGCLTVFALKPAFIEALNNKASFEIRFWIVETSNYEITTPALRSYRPIRAFFNGNGFAEAIKGSMAVGTKPN